MLDSLNGYRRNSEDGTLISVLIADDHEMVRQSIALLLAASGVINVTAEAKDGEEAIKLVEKNAIDVVLMDVRMPGLSGLEATKRILKQHPQAKIIGLSGYNDGSYPSLFMRAGAMGYITKDTGLNDMVTAIKTVHNGATYLSPAIAQRVAEQRDHSSENPFDSLAERERQIALMLLECYQLEEIAGKLSLNLRSVRNYRGRIFDKLNLKTEVELTLLGLRFGMIETDSLPRS